MIILQFSLNQMLFPAFELIRIEICSIDVVFANSNTFVCVLISNFPQTDQQMIGVCVYVCA